MRGVPVLILLLGVGVLLVAGDDTQCKEEIEERNELTSNVPHPITNQQPSSVKHKRCSYNLKSTNTKQSGLKELLEQRRLEALCKFCKKSELRMSKIPLCKKCINNPDSSTALLESTRAFEEKTSMGNSVERKTGNIPSSLSDRVAHLDALTNPDVRESILKLITSPLTSTGSLLQTLHAPRATKQTLGLGEEQFPTDQWDHRKDDDHILESYPSKVSPVHTPEDDNLNKITRDFNFNTPTFHQNENPNPTNEITRNKRLKDISRLTHEDFLKILKSALRSEENPRSLEIRKRNSVTTEHGENLKKSLFFLPHQVGILGSESESKEYDDFDEDAAYEEYMGRKAKSSEEKNVSLTTKESSTETKVFSQNDEVVSTTHNNQNDNKYHAQFNSNKQQTNTQIKDTNGTTNETKKILNNIIEKDQPNTKNILENATKILPTNLNINTISPKPTNATKLETKTFHPLTETIEKIRNTQLSFKNSLQTTKQGNDVSKFLLESSTVTTNFENEFERKINLQNINNDFSTNTNSEFRSTRSTRDITELEKDPTTKHISTFESTTPNEVKIEFLNNTNTNLHGIIKKVLPTTFINPNLKSPLLNQNRQHAIFTNHLNMDPNVNTDKYKNLHFDHSNSKEFVALNNCEDCKNINQLSDKIYRLKDNKINLPLILKQKEDGTVQLFLDKSICDCSKCLSSENEKYVFKRKTEDNLSKYPLNIFNILDKHDDQSSTNINNYLQVPTTQNIDEELKDRFYKYLIDEQLYNLFSNLNIPVESSLELHSYIDDLSDREKNKLKEFLLRNISNNYSKDGNQINEDLYIEKQNEFLQKILNKFETTTESNRITLQIKSEDHDNSQENSLNINYNNILKSFIQNQILNEIKNNNLCSICNRQHCVCQNNDFIYPKDNEGRIIDKRHYTHHPVINNLNENDGLINKKYKIVNNLLNWARDVVVPNKKY